MPAETRKRPCVCGHSFHMRALLGSTKCLEQGCDCTEYREAGSYLQSAEFGGFDHADILKAYITGARSGRDHRPTDELIARSADAYIKSVAPRHFDLSLDLLPAPGSPSSARDEGAP